MRKKVILQTKRSLSIMLVLLLLFNAMPWVLAASDSTSDAPTIDELLNEYYAKCVEIESNSGNARAWRNLWPSREYVGNATYYHDGEEIICHYEYY